MAATRNKAAAEISLITRLAIAPLPLKLLPTWKCGGMMTGVGDPELMVRMESCRMEEGLGDGDCPST